MHPKSNASLPHCEQTKVLNCSISSPTVQQWIHRLRPELWLCKMLGIYLVFRLSKGLYINRSITKMLYVMHITSILG